MLLPYKFVLLEQNILRSPLGTVFSTCVSYTLGCLKLTQRHLHNKRGRYRQVSTSICCPGKWGEEELIRDPNMFIIEFFPWLIHIFFLNSLRYCKADKYSSFDFKKRGGITLLKEEKEGIIFPLSGSLTGRDFLCLVFKPQHAIDRNGYLRQRRSLLQFG